MSILAPIPLAQWREILTTVTISFYANGGEGEMEADTPDEDGHYTLPENGFTAPEDKEFIGWQVGEEAWQVGDEITVEEDVTILALWQYEGVVTITFEANGGEGEMEPAMTDTEGNYELQESAFTAPEGMEFAGWLIDEEVKQAGETIAVTEATTAVAQWQEVEVEAETETEEAASIAVTFDGNGAEGEMEPIEPDEEGNCELPESAFTAPEGMAFAGWLIGEEVKQAGETIAVTEATTAVAQWLEAEAEAEAEAETEALPEDEEAAEANPEGEEAAEVEPEGEEAAEAEPEGEEAAEAEPEGEEGTEANPEGEEATEAEPEGEEATEANPEGEESAEAQPAGATVETTKTWTVLFYENGGEGEMEGVEIEDQGEYKLPENGFTAPEGATFTGWLVGEETLQPGDTVAVSGDLLIMPQWAMPEAEAPAEAEAEAVEPETKATETEAEAPAEVEAAEHETEAEAPAEAEAAEPETEAEAPAEAETEAAVEAEPAQATQENTEPEPKAEPKKASRTILFYENGGEGEMESVSVEDQSEYVLPACGFAAPEGTAFGGWDIGGDIYKAGDTITVTEDTMLTAVCESTEPAEAEAPAVEEPAQTKSQAAPIEAESEAVPAEVEPEQAEPETEQPLEVEPEPEQAVEVEPEQAATETEEAAEAIALEAEAPAETESAQQGAECTVSFDAGGGDGKMKAVKTNEGAEYTLPESAFKLEGYVFGSWEISGAGIEEPYAVNAGDTIIVTGDMTATALWAEDEGYVPQEETAEALEPEPAPEQAAEADEGNGLVVEYEDVPEELPDMVVDEGATVTEEAPAEEIPVEAAVEENAPSETGTAVSGTGIAAIVTAAVLAIAAALFAILKKKKK